MRTHTWIKALALGCLAWVALVGGCSCEERSPGPAHTTCAMLDDCWAECDRSECRRSCVDQATPLALEVHDRWRDCLDRSRCASRDDSRCVLARCADVAEECGWLPPDQRPGEGEGEGEGEGDIRDRLGPVVDDTPCDDEEICNGLDEDCDGEVDEEADGMPLAGCEASDGDVRLNAGMRPYEGRAEVFHEGRWGTICDHGFSLTNGGVFCRQLGFDVASDIYPAARFGRPDPSHPQWMDLVACEGGEARLADCNF